jgi:predicted RNA methylase
MAKRRELTDDEVNAWWKSLPTADRRFFRALLDIRHVIGDRSLRYGEPPPGLQRALRKADRNTLFSVIAECLYMLLDAPAMRVVKRIHRRHKRQSAARPSPPTAGGTDI